MTNKHSTPPISVAIIGAGATGVELAAELHRTTREVVAFGLDGIDEVISENFTGNVSNPLSWPILVYIITDGM